MDLDIEMDDAVETVHDGPIADVGRDDILVRIGSQLFSLAPTH